MGGFKYRKYDSIVVKSGDSYDCLMFVGFVTLCFHLIFAYRNLNR